MQSSPTTSAVYCSVIVIVMSLAACCGAETVDFNRDIRPILSNNCFQCHGPDSHHREADLRLDDESAAKEYAIVPGDLESELIARITSTDADTIMPPPDSAKSLDERQIALLKQWIADGAAWSQHWAYERPVRHEVPSLEVAAGDAARTSRMKTHWIDAFIAQRLDREGLTFSQPTDDVTLIRRLHFDLTGLPPGPDEVRRELEMLKTAGGYEAVVDSLLDSPHFGERMAVYWLDLVRYADTVGYHGDQDQNISPYRDYVIDAFNRNLPFDQFTREQLAGDLLPNPTIDQKIATGYNRMLQTSHEGGVQPQEYLAIYQADRVRNLSAVWLGATLGCAQCHDHKYDPYTSKDFYSMAAFFADVDEAQHFRKGTNSLPTARPPELEVLNRADRERLQFLNDKIEELTSAGGDDELVAEFTAEKKQLEANRRKVMITVALETPRTIRVLPRGNYLDESGPIVEPAIPEFLGKLDTSERSSRLDLADWLVDDNAGVGLLTARVMANRIWYLLFGEGLSSSLDDFGGQGTPPVHPELLDNLAMEFVSNGWNVKQLIKSIVMTRTYQQSSVATDELLKRDPNNTLFARQSRFRLPAEMIRDAALHAGGLLVQEFGGPSVKPYQPLGYYRHLNFPQRRYAHHGDQRQWRRGVYVHWQRQFLHPMLRAFDAPTREECTAKRPKSNTPLAALVLLNDPTFVEAARGLAHRLLATDHDTDAERIQQAFEIVLSRMPSEFEVNTLLSLLSTGRREYEAEETSASKTLEIGEKDHLADNPVELAAWTNVARAILNLGEANTRQ